MADSSLDFDSLEEYPSIIQAPSITKGTNIELDFSRIKQQLRTYLQGQSQFNDYNFEASGLSFLLDILAYNTQMNAMTAHLVLNELFLESAQARPNAVALSKQLGYLPSSVTGSTATINVTVKPKLSGSSYTSETLVLEKDTQFNGGKYTWYVQERIETTIGANGWFYFQNVPIKQGVKKTIRYFYDSRIEYPTFEIPDIDCDASTIHVQVKESQQSDYAITYNRFSKFNDLYETSAVYFIQENALGRQEIYFPSPDDLGRNLQSGNLIEISYLYSAGSKSNGVSVFSIKSNPYTNTDLVISTVQLAVGGSEKESVESIRKNAPKFYTTQNRCVTAQDYAAVIRQNAVYVEAISVWGGEDEVPPQYGRVFISIKPRNGLVLTQQQKDYITNVIIRPRNVATIRPILVDPVYTYLRTDIVLRCDPNASGRSKSQLAELCKAQTQRFNDQYLNQFNGAFRYSKFSSIIDKSELSIISSTLKVYMFKKIIVTARNQGHILKFPTSLYRYFEDKTQYLMTSPMYWGGKRYILKDFADPSNEFRRTLKIIHKEPGSVETIANNDAGYIDLETNQVFIRGLGVDLGTEVRIYARPGTFDLASAREHMLQIDSSDVHCAVEWDSIQQMGISAGPDKFNASSSSTSYNYL